MLTLRHYTDADIPLIIEHLNNPNVTRYLTSSIPQPYTESDAVWFINEATKGAIIRAVEVDGAFIGTVGVKPGQFENCRSAEIGYWLGEPYWGRGHATQVITQMTDMIFETTDIIRMTAPVHSPNEGSKRALLKSGYRLESVQEKACFKHDHFYDKYLFVKIKEEE